MSKPAWTEKVERGMWLIVGRSATVFSAENGAPGMTREERDSIIAASRYCDYHWAKHAQFWKEDRENADLSAIRVVQRKRRGARQQEAGEAEGGGPPDTEGSSG